jgi:hypothetical protein
MILPDPTADLIQSWGYTVKKAREEGLSRSQRLPRL